jgi:hypothetical protein
MTFDEWCKAHGTTPEQSQILSSTDRDLIEQPPTDCTRVRLGKSKIHGTGIFSCRGFGPHTFVGLALDENLRRTCVIGRFINHSHTPNCYLKREPDNSFTLQTLFEINEGTELTMTYEACDLIRKGQL